MQAMGGMRTAVRRVLAAGLAVVALMLGPGAAASAGASTFPPAGGGEAYGTAYGELRHLLLESEFGAPRGRIIRWATSPRVGVIGARAEDRAHIAGLMAEISDLWRGTGLAMVPVEPDAADFLVVFAPGPALPAVARDFGVPYLPGNDGFAVPAYDRASFTIRRAVVLIDANLRGWRRRATLVQEFVQALGITTDNPGRPESIFFEKGDFSSTATAMSAHDRAVLRLLYRRLKPGDGRLALWIAYQMHWPE